MALDRRRCLEQENYRSKEILHESQSRSSQVNRLRTLLSGSVLYYSISNLLQKNALHGHLLSYR